MIIIIIICIDGAFVVIILFILIYMQFHFLITYLAEH